MTVNWTTNFLIATYLALVINIRVLSSLSSQLVTWSIVMKVTEFFFSFFVARSFDITKAEDMIRSVSI
mgnify:CR=1 FL=1